MGKFIIKKTKTGFNFNLKAGNGEIIATSEVYKTIANCRNGVQSVIKNAPVAGVEDHTLENFEKVKHPKFEIYADKSGQFRFRLKAKNGEIIAVGEGYTTKAACKNGVDSVMRNAADSTIEEQL